MPFRIEVEKEDDERWLAEIPELPGTKSYRDSKQDAIERVEVLGLRVIADRLEHGELK